VAEPMEIRNAVFPGPFNKQLHKLSQNPTFCSLWEIPLEPDKRANNPLYSRMRDLELVLRFFALADYEHMEMRFKDYLSEYMDLRNQAYLSDQTLAQKDTDLFIRGVNNSRRVFGDNAFRKPLPNSNLGYKSAPLADAVMVGLSRVDTADLTEQ